MDRSTGDALRPQHASSIISSRMTDIVSEDGDEYYPEGAAAAANTKPKKRGESTTISSHPSSPPQTSYTRRIIANRRGGHTFGGLGISMTNTSRPQSPYSQTASMTHAPSLTSQAFFRPMSSQRLQAQRSTRPSTAVREELPRLSSSTANRPSIDTYRATTPQRGDIGPPPSSRGTDFTEHDPRDRALYNVSPTGNHTIQSASESTRPLQASAFQAQRIESQDQRDLAATKTPMSFKSNFIRYSRAAPTPVSTQLPQRERLSNETNSPQLQEKESARLDMFPGKNHEYFSGNTVFCWGGRLQNTRDRPINIITGILVVVPSILFFAFV